MYKKTFKQRVKSLGVPFLFLIGIILVLEIVILVFNIPHFIFPSPIKIIWEIGNNFAYLLDNSLITFIEAFLGFLIANMVGFLIAVSFAYSKTIKKGLYPYAIALKTTPIIALAPLLILWFGTGIFSKVVAAAIICFFPILVNTTKGLNSVNGDLLDLFKSFSATKWQIFTKLKLPISFPYIFSALKVSAGLAVVGAVVGEFIGANAGIGHIILLSSYRLETTTMFAAIIMSSLIGILFFLLVVYIEKKVVYWED